MLCHSVVSRVAYEQLQHVGRVGPDPTQVTGAVHNDDDFAAANDWMRWQMSQRIIGYTGRYPIWVWARMTRAELVSMVRNTVHEPGGSVLVTLGVPREQLLLTDFTEWHTVLMGGPSAPLDCPACGTRHCNVPACLDGWFDQWLDDRNDHVRRAGAEPNGPWWQWPSTLQAEVFATWQNLIDPPRRRELQGCVEHLQAAWVHSAVTLAD